MCACACVPAPARTVHEQRAPRPKFQVPSSKFQVSWAPPVGQPRSIFHAGQPAFLSSPPRAERRAARFTGRHLQWGTGWPRWLAIGDRAGTGGGGGGGHGAELESWELAFQVPKREPRFLLKARKLTGAQAHSLSNPIPGFGISRFSRRRGILWGEEEEEQEEKEEQEQEQEQEEQEQEQEEQ